MRGRILTIGIPEDEAPGKTYDLRLVARLSKYLRPHAGMALLSLSVLILDSLLDLAGPYLTKVAIDEQISKGESSGLWALGLLYVAALFLGFATRYLRVYLLQLTGQRMIFRLRMEIFDHLLAMSQSFFDRTPAGRLITRAIQDVEVINELFTQGVIVVFGDLVTLLGIAVVLFWLDWRLALAVFALSPLVVLATILYRTKARDVYREVRRCVAQLNAYLQENLNGMTTVQLFLRQDENFRQFDRMNRETRDQHLRSILYSSVFFPCVEIIAAMALGLVIWYGGGRVMQEALLPGVLVAFIQYLRRFFQPVRDLAEKYNIFQAAMAASERIFGLLDTPVEPPVPPVHRRPAQSRGEIRVEDLWFSYNSSEWVLQSVSLEMHPGKTVALVGATGAGKSSLIGLLTRAYEPQRGRILLDGVDVRHWSKEDLRRYVGIVPQEVFLFSGPLMENLRLWDGRVSEERVREVADALGVDRLIRDLPGGYRMAVAERGENLSLGQRQLLAFVRVMVYDPRVLVLDEATSSVDPASEAMIQEAMARLLRGRTSLIIAHRLSTIQNAQRIIVLHHGRVHEQGTHEELLARDGIYQRLYRLHLSMPGASRL